MLDSFKKIPWLVGVLVLFGVGYFVSVSAAATSSTASVGLEVTHDIPAPTIAPELVNIYSIRVFGETIPLSTLTIHMTGVLDAGGTVTDTFTTVADSNGSWTYTTGPLALGVYSFSAFTTTLIGDVSPSSNVVTQPVIAPIIPPDPTPTPTPAPAPGGGGGNSGGGNGGGGGGSSTTTDTTSNTITSSGSATTTPDTTPNSDVSVLPPSGGEALFPITTSPPVGTSVVPITPDYTKGIIERGIQALKSVTGIVAEGIQKSLIDHPGTLASAIAMTALASAITPVVLGSAALHTIMPAFYRFFDGFGRTFFAFFGAGRRRREWGIVYDGATGRPIPTAIVTLYNVQKGNVIETKVTDKYGSYYFSVLEGQYEIRVKKDGYSLPESLDHSSIKAFYKDIYLTGVIDVKHEDVLHKDIPMISNEHAKISFAKLFMLGFGKMCARLLFYGGFAVSLYMVYFDHSLLNILLVLFYSLMLAMRLVYVGETKSGHALTIARKPLPFVWIKVMNKSTGEREARIITDEHGRYFLILNEGNYTIEASSVDNSLQVIQDLIFKKRGPLNMDIILHP